MMAAQHEEAYPKMYLYKRIVQAKLFIDANYTEQLDLHQIADEAFFSRFHFLRLFRQTYGATPHQYLVSKRVAKARELLEQGLPVSQVCSDIGFESLGSFSSLFKKQTGESPSAYQLRRRQLRAEVAEVPLRFVPNCFLHARTSATI
ncbi:MAG: AraC family transcriptional regulator [Bacteroidota bacterium]